MALYGRVPVVPVREHCGCSSGVVQKLSFYPGRAHANKRRSRTFPAFSDPLPVFLDLLSAFTFSVGKSCMEKCN